MIGGGGLELDWVMVGVICCEFVGVTCGVRSGWVWSESVVCEGCVVYGVVWYV